MCYIIDGTAKVSDPTFFNATTSLELPLIFRIIFGIPDYFTALCSIQMIFPFCWKMGGGRGVGVDIWTLFREFKGVVLNFWSFLLLLFLFVASDLNIEQGKTKINDLQGNSL